LFFPLFFYFFVSCDSDDLRYFQVHLAFNACKEILILWPGAKTAQSRGQKARDLTRALTENKNKFHKGLHTLQ